MIKSNDDYDLDSYLANQAKTFATVKESDSRSLDFKQHVKGLKFMEIAYPQKSLYEQQFYQQGARFIAGVDEVGRGCLAGPLVAAAVILPMDFSCPLELNDSKQLTAKQREKLSEQIKKQAIAYAIEEASVEEIAEFNILEADKRAMCRALDRLNPQADALLVDYIALAYSTQYGCIHPAKGDNLSYSIAAASIIAKVYRDKLMENLALEFPVYAWAENKGYGTKAHYQALDTYGPCRWHRQLFLRKWQAQKENTNNR